MAGEIEMFIDYSKRLNEFTDKLKANPKIIAVYFTGSTSKQSWDEYSDIDIDIVVEDKDYRQFLKEIPKLLSFWGKIKFYNNYKDYDETYAFVGKEYLKVEIDPINKSGLKPSWIYKDAKIAFDKEGTLTKVFKKSQKEKRPLLNHKELAHFFLDTRNNFIYSVRHYARGQKLSGAGELRRISGDLFYYLGKIKGMEGYENIRNAEKHLTNKEMDFVKDSELKSLNKKEVIKIIRVEWKYMKYLEKLYEKTSKRKLNFKCDDKEIFNLLIKILK